MSHALHAHGAPTLGRRRLHRRGHRVRAGLRRRRRRPPPSRGRLHRSRSRCRRKQLVGMSPRRFPIPVHLARIEMGWLAGCFGATDTQRRSRKLREGAPLRSTIYRARRRRATFPSTTPFAALLRLHRLPCMAVSVCRRVWGRMCRGKRPGSALGSQQRPERRGPIRRSRPFGPKRTTPRDGTARLLLLC